MCRPAVSYEVGRTGRDLPDGDAHFRVDERRAVTADAALDAPAQRGQQAEGQPQIKIGGRVVRQPGAADHEAGGKTDEDARHDPHVERLLEDHPSEDGPDGRTQGAQRHHHRPGILQAQHITGAGQRPADEGGSRHDDAGARAPATGHVAELALERGKQQGPKRAETVRHRRAQRAEQKKRGHGGQAGFLIVPAAPDAEAHAQRHEG